MSENGNKRNLKINWDIRARVDTVDKETLKAMKETGCQRINDKDQSCFEYFKDLNFIFFTTGFWLKNS